MIPTEYAEREKLARHMLRELELPRKPLNKWEEGFVASITDKLDNEQWVTDNMIEKLQEIYEEKT